VSIEVWMLLSLTLPQLYQNISKRFSSLFVDMVFLITEVATYLVYAHGDPECVGVG